MKRTVSIFCLILASAALAHAGFPVRTNSMGTEDISVMSFNTGKYEKDASEHKWSDRLPGIISMINDENPLVIGFQSMVSVQRRDMDTALPSYSGIGAGVHDGKDKGPQNAIYYRNDLLRLEKSGTFWFSDTPDKPKTKFECAQQHCCATWAVFSIVSSGRRFIILNTYLDHKSAKARGLQAQMILEKLDEYGKGLPAIVMGSFNELQAGTFGKDMTNPSVVLSTKMIDGRRMSLSTSNAKSINNYGSKKGSVKDFIFYTPEFEGLLFKTITAEYEGVKYLSNHNPIRDVVRFLE